MIEIGNLSSQSRVSYTMGVLPMKRANCSLGCVNWRNVILYLLLSVLAVILLCLLPRWVLCFLVVALACGCGALMFMKR